MGAHVSFSFDSQLGGRLAFGNKCYAMDHFSKTKLEEYYNRDNRITREWEKGGYKAAIAAAK